MISPDTSSRCLLNRKQLPGTAQERGPKMQTLRSMDASELLALLGGAGRAVVPKVTWRYFTLPAHGSLAADQLSLLAQEA